MMVCRALLATAIVGITLHQAGAQFGGMPGAPGGPGAGFGGPPAGPPPQCQQLLSLRDDLQKYGSAIEAANSRKADVKIACRLFRTYLATEAKMLRALETVGPQCGVPQQVNQQVKASHAKATQIGKTVCDAAARGSTQSGPSLSDALGTSPSIPDSNTQKGAGTFDTLTGNPFAR